MSKTRSNTQSTDARSTHGFETSDSPIAAFLALLYRVLAWTFGLVGALFFLFPDGTIDVLNAFGGWFGFPTAPHLSHRFWLSLGVAYMAVVTVLAASISKAPIERRLLMVPLAAGKATSSLTCLWYFLSYDRYFVYLANFLVDGLLALFAWATFIATAPGSAGLGPHARRVLQAVAEALFPPREPGSQMVHFQELTDQMEIHLSERGPLVLQGFRWLLGFVDWNPRLFHLRRCRLCELPWEERVSILESMERSRWFFRRQAVHMLKVLLGLHGYSIPALRGDLQVNDDWLSSRLELARTRRQQGEKGPYPLPTATE